MCCVQGLPNLPLAFMLRSQTLLLRLEDLVLLLQKVSVSCFARKLFQAVHCILLLHMSMYSFPRLMSHHSPQTRFRYLPPTAIRSELLTTIVFSTVTCSRGQRHSALPA